MKRIFVSFKMVNDYEQVLPEDWDAFLQEDAALDYVRQIVNCFDESALELALRIKDYYSQIGEETELTALTIANDSPSFLKPYLQRDMTGSFGLPPLLEKIFRLCPSRTRFYPLSGKNKQDLTLSCSGSRPPLLTVARYPILSHKALESPPFPISSHLRQKQTLLWPSLKKATIF